MKTNDFDYFLPPELIAQQPLPRRDMSRMMVVERNSGRIIHSRFRELPAYLCPGDSLVLNNTRVRPCRIFVKAGERRVELLLSDCLAPGLYRGMVRNSRKLKTGTMFTVEDTGVTGILERDDAGLRVRFPEGENIEFLLEQYGRMPLPPYIKRESLDADRERYQTVFAQQGKAIAAPTAGLHFTDESLVRLKEAGIETVYVTLHVGIGTFSPVRCEDIRDHRMHSEDYELTKEAAESIAKTRNRKGRIGCVGTTSCRVLESCGRIGENGSLELIPGFGSTEIFIYPPYRFKAVDLMLTNFHLPRSTLLMLVSAFAGTELIQEAYRKAVEQKYRFFSYGDCMLIV